MFPQISLKRLIDWVLSLKYSESVLNALEALEKKLFWNVTVLALGTSNKILFDEAVRLVTLFRG